MQYSLVFYLIMLLGFFNGLIVSLFIFLRTKSSIFLRLAALGVFLFSLSILREFLYVFGDEIELHFLIENFLNFKLLAVGVVIMAYDKASSDKANNYFLLLPGLLEFILLSYISLGCAFWEDIVSDTMFIMVDCISFFWILYLFNVRRKTGRKEKEELKFLSFFVLGFLLIFLTRVIQLLAITFESNELYEFHFLFRIIAIGVVIYLISINLIISYAKYGKRKARNDSSIKPKSVQFLKKIQEEQKFLNQDITLEKLASYYNVDSKTLSATIRQHKNTNFNDYLNSLRLTHFMSLIENLEHKKLTLLALAEKSGFNSKATFNRVFKKKYGTSPSSYITQNY